MLYEIKFEDLVFKIKEEVKVPIGKKGYKQIRLIIDCPYCGTEFRVAKSDLKSGHTKSCGCLQKKLLAEKQTTHGLRHHPLYLTVQGGINRCTKPKTTRYDYYGGRGIQWKLGGFSEAIPYLEKLENSLIEGYQMDRIDTNGNYEKGNIRFITGIENMNNTRSNINITHNGKTQSIAMWSRELGIPHATIKNRHRLGLEVEQILGKDKIERIRNGHCKNKAFINGEELSLKEISKKYGIKLTALVYKYSKGIRGNELLLPMKRKSVNELPK